MVAESASSIEALKAVEEGRDVDWSSISGLNLRVASSIEALNLRARLRRKGGMSIGALDVD